jgi:soluble lytic murein transglycosylase-like protein
MTSIQSQIEAVASAAGVDPGIALAVAQQESGFNPGAIGAAGEIGLFQLMPATAAGLGVNPSDVNQNIQGGVQYLAQLYGSFNSWALALAAYNWGPGNVQNMLNSGGSPPASVQSYVNSVLATAASYDGGAAPTTPGFSLAGVEADVASVVPASWVPTTPMGWAAAGVGALVVLKVFFF